MFTENSGISASYLLETGGFRADPPHCCTVTYKDCDTSGPAPRERTPPRRRRSSARAAGGRPLRTRHLTLRGRTWHFRKRAPERLRALGIRMVRVISLRTWSQNEAVARALRLAAVLEEAWEWVDMRMNQARPLPAGAIDQVVNELLVKALAEIITEHERGLARTREEADAALARVDAERGELEDEALLRNFSRAKAETAAAVRKLGYDESTEPETRQQLYARGFAAMRQINSVTFEVESGRPLDEGAAAAKIPDPVVVEARQHAANRRVTVSEAFEASIRYATSKDNQNHARSAKRVALEFWGDVPLSSLGSENLVELLLFARRLPVNHGRKHGKNRYTDKGTVRRKTEEIEAADAQDAALRERIGAMDLSPREKRARIEQGLTRRLNLTTLKKIHAFVRRAFRDAEAHLGYKSGEMPEALDAFRKRAEAVAAREGAEGGALATRRRVRSAWSDERLQTLFNSPIYRGCRPRRRHMHGPNIIRDVVYWAPLLAATTGMRPEEFLQLQKEDIRRRNGILAIRVRGENGRSIKTEDTARHIPIPDALLRLGFMEWLNAMRTRPGRFVFPEIAETDSESRLSGIFGGRFTSIREGLKIADESEDFYALRKTFNSRLAATGVQDSDCRALLGHKHGDITNLHYTDRELGRLKALVDQVDYRFEIAGSAEHGFPVIKACRLEMREKVEVSIALYDDGNPKSVTLGAGAGLTRFDIAPMKSWSCHGRETPPEGAVMANMAAPLLLSALSDRAPVFRADAERSAWEYLTSLE